LPHWSSRRLVGLALAMALLAAQLLALPARAQDVVDFCTIARATVYITSVYDAPGGRAVSCTS